MVEWKREGERGSVRERQAERGSNVSTCLSATLDNQHSKQMEAHAYRQRIESGREGQKERGPDKGLLY